MEKVTAAKGMNASRSRELPRKERTCGWGHVKNGVPGIVELLIKRSLHINQSNAQF
jgi:hypothetical protein